MANLRYTILEALKTRLYKMMVANDYNFTVKAVDFFASPWDDPDVNPMLPYCGIDAGDEVISEFPGHREVDWTIRLYYHTTCGKTTSEMTRVSSLLADDLMKAIYGDQDIGLENVIQMSARLGRIPTGSHEAAQMGRATAALQLVIKFWEDIETS